MPLLRPAIAAALLVCALAAASAEAVCELQTSGDWGPASVFTGATSCAALDGSEEIRIPAGVAVRIVDDLVLGALPGQQLRVSSGGTLRARGAERSGGPGPLTVAFTPKGLFCERGSECVFEGVYRQVGVPSPSPRASLVEAGWLPAGDVVPCPGWDDSARRWVPDCAGLLAASGDPADLPGSAFEVGFVYSPGAAIAPPFLAASLEAMQPGDVLCFTDPDPATPAAPVDDGFCYEITFARGDFGGAGVLVFDVRQTNPNRPRNTSYPFSLREVREGGLLAGATKGSRIAVTSPGVLGGGRASERVGMWLRFASPSGAPRPESYKIARTWDAPAAGVAPVDCPGGPGSCDVLEIYDPRGFQSAPREGDALWVDYGHAPGEAFFVMAPLLLTEADGLQEPSKDASFVLQGETSVGAVLVEDTASFRLFGADVNRFEDVWLRDVVSGGGNGVALSIFDVEGALLRRVSLTGGNGGPSGVDRMHSVGLGPFAASLTFRNLAIRHHGDDGLTHSSSAQLDVERYRLEWATPGAVSCNLIGQNNPAGVLSGAGRDLLCLDCNRGGPVVRTQPALDFDIQGLARWGSAEGFDSENGPGLLVEELLQVGGGGSLPSRVDGFVVALENGAAALSGPRHREIRSGIVRDTKVTGRAVLGPMDAGSVDNVALFDVDTIRSCAGECAVLRLSGAPSLGMRVSDVSVAVSPDRATRFDAGAEAVATGGSFRVDGLLVSGMSRSTGAGRGVSGAAAGMALVFGATAFGPFLYDNRVDAQSPGSLPPSAVLGVDPGFVNPAARRFDTAPGSAADLAGSGIRRGPEAPGGGSYRWMHAITRTQPEVMGDPCSDGRDNDGDGLADFPADPGCRSATSREDPECQDGVDNDPGQDTRVDWDGGASAGVPAALQTLPDPECTGRPWKSLEAKVGCGLGFELMLVAPLLARLGRRARRV
jgi:hypothetical protein